MEKYILIVAGGKGVRMQSDEPKQFAVINGRPLLMWTFEAFRFLKHEAHFILMLHAGQISRWEALCHEHHFDFKHQVIEGGPERYHSVKVGLKKVPDKVLVAIHDAARPLVSETVIKNCFSVARQKGNAIPSVPMRESLRQVDASINWQADRNKFRIIQTPQTFLSDDIKKAYLQSYREKFTDDASVLESGGGQIQLVDGDESNIKITHPNDLVIASALLKSRE